MVLNATPPPKLFLKTFFWGGAGGGIGWRVCVRGGVASATWGGPKVGGGGAAHNPLLPHAYLQGGCVSRDLGVRIYVYDNSAFPSLP